jgi:hypothetical protein
VFDPWLSLGLNAFQIGVEAQSVIALRMLRFAAGGALMQAEANRMVTQKVLAAAEAQSSAAVAAMQGKKKHVVAGKCLTLMGNASALTGVRFLALPPGCPVRALALWKEHNVEESDFFVSLQQIHKPRASPAPARLLTGTSGGRMAVAWPPVSRSGRNRQNIIGTRRTQALRVAVCRPLTAAYLNVNVIYIHTAFEANAMGFFLMMILGFIWWWPLGLIILVALMASGRIGYWRRPVLAGNGPMGDWHHATSMDRIQEKRDRIPDRIDRLRDQVRGRPPSSGNRAFDDYRAETLRGLECEQREFKEFLKRLRVARDRAEFDQFMNERNIADRRLDDAPSASITGHQSVSLPSDRESR